MMTNWVRPGAAEQAADDSEVAGGHVRSEEHVHQGEDRCQPDGGPSGRRRTVGRHKAQEKERRSRARGTTG